MLYRSVLIEIPGQSVFLPFIILARHLITFMVAQEGFASSDSMFFKQEFFCGGCYILHFPLLVSQVHKAFYVGCMAFKIYQKKCCLGHFTSCCMRSMASCTDIGHVSMSFLSVSWTSPLLCRQLGSLNIYF